jgi:pimeloyl-ACP methyl ester carboxylesterase
VGRRWKIAIGVLVVLAALIAVNTVLVEGETKPAEVTVAGGRILHLDGGDLQIAEGGPRSGDPIVLVHCFTCAIDWWDGMRPPLESRHRVIAIDLLGFGGSEKPDSGYSIESQADVVAEALSRLGVRDATVAGHSLGGTVVTALAERHPELVGRLVIIDQAPSNDDEYERDGLPFTARLTFLPVLGPSLWRVTPDFAIEDGLSTAFAPGYDVPDAFVDDFRQMTYTSYDEAADAESDYTDERPLDERIDASGVPLLAIFGKEEQLYEPHNALDAYGQVPGAVTVLIGGAGHSPNVEQPALTARDVLRFAAGSMRPGLNMQELLQDQNPVRPRP